MRLWRKHRALWFCQSPVASQALARRTRYGNYPVNTQPGNAAQGAAVFENSRNCNVSTVGNLHALEGVDDLNGLKRQVAQFKEVAPHLRTERAQSTGALAAPVRRDEP
jgi:hypothetical protein